MSFQYTILKVAIFVLVAFLTFIGYRMYKDRLSDAEERIIGSCPDYWTLVKEGDKLKCRNDKNLGNSKCADAKIMDFSVQPYNLSDGLCAKFNWANNCELTWDGITNNKNICKK
jgi:hypothetical protein